MNRSTVTALTIAGLLSLGALSVYARQRRPINKGGMPPSTEMNAGSGPENALPPGTTEGGMVGMLMGVVLAKMAVGGDGWEWFWEYLWSIRENAIQLIQKVKPSN